ARCAKGTIPRHERAVFTFKQLDGRVEGGCTNHALYAFRSGQRSNFSKALNLLCSAIAAWLLSEFSPHLCTRVCRQLGSRRAEARKNRSPRCLRGTIPRAPHLLE